MAKITLEDVSSGFAATTLLNSNNTAIEAAIENTLSRDGTAPNYMNANLDMNGHRILNQSNPISISGFNWEGEWLTATDYVVGDVIENNGSAYVCIVAHTSGTFSTDLTAVKWQLVATASLPDQTGNAYGLLTTDGSNASWFVSTAFIRTLLDDATASEVLDTLGVSAFAKTLLNDSSAAVFRDSIGVGYGPAFAAHAGSTQSITSTVNTKVTLGTEVFDSDNCFASSRFTPNKAGYYQINAGVRGKAEDMIETTLIIYKNGVLYQQGSSFVSASTVDSSITTIYSSMIEFNGTTDYIELYGMVTGVTCSFEYLGSGSSSFLNGHFVRPL